MKLSMKVEHHRGLTRLRLNDGSASTIQKKERKKREKKTE